jgi:hypothetical protein
MNYNIATILAVIAIIFVLITYITAAPLVAAFGKSHCLKIRQLHHNV